MNDTHGSAKTPWIGVDLDGTLAEYHGWKGPEHIGPPVPLMVERIQRWLNEGMDVRIMTARVSPGKDDSEVCAKAIRQWLIKHIGQDLPITHEKDHCMVELWDDRVVQVIPNTGIRVDGQR